MVQFNSWREVRELCDKSFYHFVKIAGGAAGQGGIIVEQIHKPLCDAFQNTLLKRKCFFMPRNWLKSTVFTCWGTVWLYCRDPNIRILIASQNERNAKRFQLFIENMLLYNKVLRKIYPEVLYLITPKYKKLARWSSEEMYLPRDIYYKEASITSIGLGGAAQSGHYNWVIVDDPVGKKHMESLPELEKVLNWQDNVKELLDNPNFMHPEASTVMIVCTFWGPGDYGSYVMTEYPEYKFWVVPAMKYPDVKDEDNITYIQDPEAVVNTSNWDGAPGGRSTTVYYESLLANPQQHLIFWAQHMNMPQKVGGLHKFDVEWFRPFHYEDRENELSHEMETWIVCDDDGETFRYNDVPKWAGIDPGGFAETKGLKRGSKLAMLIAGKPENSIKKFALWNWSGTFKEPSKFLITSFQAHQKWKPLCWYVETIGAQKYMYRDLKETSRKGVTDEDGKVWKAPGMIVREFEVCPREGDKHLDIVNLIKPAENGEFYVHRNLCKPLMGEVRNWPKGMTEDSIDLLAKLYKHKLRIHRPADWKEQLLLKQRETTQRRGEMGY